MRWVPPALLALIAAAAAVEAARLGLGEAGRPGPGFFPFWLAGTLAVAAAALSWRSRGEQAAVSLDGVGSSHSRQALWAFLGLAAYCAALVPLGFLLATFFFFSAETIIIEMKSWRTAMQTSAIATLAAFGLFQLLNVQLPSGYWMR